jgi:hypothetical protein
MEVVKFRRAPVFADADEREEVSDASCIGSKLEAS